VVVDGDVNIHDNAEVARYIGAHVHPAHDIIFSQGPTDVLDHSCSVMAYGGKMGIDATSKLPEELVGRTEDFSNNTKLDVDDVLRAYPEVKEINSSLLDMGVPLVFASIEKNRKGHVREMANRILERPDFSGVKVLIFLEHTLEVSDIADAVWRFSNNVDPRRDHVMVGDRIAFDGTRKTKEHDGFTRDWPNILASDMKTLLPLVDKVKAAE
ncbi:MAG: menaquinone biosynthesis decarboxylase, partial [Bacteroidota bacterium]